MYRTKFRETSEVTREREVVFLRESFQQKIILIAQLRMNHNTQSIKYEYTVQHRLHTIININIRILKKKNTV